MMMKKMMMKKRIGALLCACLLLMTLTGCAGAQTPGENTEKPQVLELFKEVGLDLSPYEGKVIYLNFFTQWCGYCMQEMPDIKAVHESYSEDDLQVILVHAWDGENKAATESVRKTYGMEDMTFHEDRDLSVAALVGLQGYPAHLFIDRDGTLAAGMNYALDYEALAVQLDQMGVAKKAVAQ